jgi:hypothetical protein
MIAMRHLTKRMQIFVVLANGSNGAKAVTRDWLLSTHTGQWL